MSWVPCKCDCKVICVFAGSTVMSICKFYSIITCLSALCLRLKVVCVFARCTIMSICNFYSIMTCLGCPVNVIARWSVSLLGAQSCQFVRSAQSWHVLSALCLQLQGGLKVLLNHGMSWVPCACDCKVPCACDCKVPYVWDCKVIWVYAGCTVMSICKFYSIMTCLECPVPATARWSVSLWVHSHVNFKFYSIMTCPCACHCKVVCVFAGCAVMSICKFYSIMTCLECPEPVTARLSVSLLGAQPCQFASSTQSWHVLSALCLWLQGCLCLCWVHSHVNLQVLLNHDMSWVPCAVRLSVSLLGAQPCQFASSTQSWHVWVPCACDCKVVCVFAGSTVMSVCNFYSIMTCLSALCLRLQGGLCLYWEHSHVNF